MSTEETKKWAHQLSDAINRALRTGDFDLLDAVVAVDFAEHSPAPSQGPGLAGWKQSMAESRVAFPDMQFELHDVFADGDKAVVHQIVTGTHTGDAPGFPATGKRMAARSIDIMRFESGKAIEHWGVFDEAGMMRQLGLFPMPESAGSE